MTPRKTLTHKWSIVCAWMLAAAIGVFAALFREGALHTQWLLLAIGVTTLVAGALQLIVADKEGFIVRISLSVAGALAVLFLTNLITDFLL